MDVVTTRKFSSFVPARRTVDVCEHSPFYPPLQNKYYENSYKFHLVFFLCIQIAHLQTSAKRYINKYIQRVVPSQWWNGLGVSHNNLNLFAKYKLSVFLSVFYVTRDARNRNDKISFACEKLRTKANIFHSVNLCCFIVVTARWIFSSLQFNFMAADEAKNARLLKMLSGGFFCFGRDSICVICLLRWRPDWKGTEKGNGLSSADELNKEEGEMGWAYCQ